MSLSETFLLVIRFVVYILLCRVLLHAPVVLLLNLGAASRISLIGGLAVAQVFGACLGQLVRGIPNVISVGDNYLCHRNLISFHLYSLGGAAALGISFRGLLMAGDEKVDQCAVLGLQMPARYLGALSVDLPHLIISACALGALSGEDEYPQADLCRFLSISSLTLASVCLGWMVKIYRVDTLKFIYGTEYQRRIEYLEKKARTTFRWRAMQRKMREARRILREKKEKEQSDLLS